MVCKSCKAWRGSCRIAGSPGWRATASRRLVEAAPFIHEVIHFRRKEGLRGLWEVLKTLRGRSFDAVWDMQGLLRSGLMAAAARAPRKWGRRDSREGAGLFYNRPDRAARRGGPAPRDPDPAGIPVSPGAGRRGDHFRWS